MIFKRIISIWITALNIDINIHATDDQDFASTVLWLEDQKIRHYKIEEREPLRNIDNYAEWESAFEKYKTDIGAPKFETRIEDLQWILSYAVRLEYMDRADEYKNITGELVNEAKKPPTQQHRQKTPSIRWIWNVKISNKVFESWHECSILHIIQTILWWVFRFTQIDRNIINHFNY